jgi:hypothetical protein
LVRKSERAFGVPKGTISFDFDDETKLKNHSFKKQDWIFEVTFH